MQSMRYSSTYLKLCRTLVCISATVVCPYPHFVDTVLYIYKYMYKYIYVLSNAIIVHMPWVRRRECSYRGISLPSITGQLSVL